MLFIVEGQLCFSETQSALSSPTFTNKEEVKVQVQQYAETLHIVVITSPGMFHEMIFVAFHSIARKPPGYWPMTWYISLKF